MVHTSQPVATDASVEELDELVAPGFWDFVVGVTVAAAFGTLILLAT